MVGKYRGVLPPETAGAAAIAAGKACYFRGEGAASLDAEADLVRAGIIIVVYLL